MPIWAPPTPGLWYLNIQYAQVLTSEARNNAAYGDLATAGPQVTVTINASGISLALFCVHVTTNAVNPQALASISVDGGTPADAQGLEVFLATTIATPVISSTSFQFFSGLTPGNHTFKLQYRTTGNCNFLNRRMAVLPL